MSTFVQYLQLFFFGAVFLSFFLISGGRVVAAPTSPPIIFSYTGRILDDDSVPLTSSTVNMQFRLYTEVSGGTCLWSNDSEVCGTNEDMAVTLSEGVFTVHLGDGIEGGTETIDTATFTERPSVYLEVQIEDEVLSPRKRITAAPYAISAYSAYTLQGYQPDYNVGPSEIAQTNSAGKILFTGATGISNTVTDAILRIDATTAQVNDALDVMFAITTDSGANTHFYVTRDNVNVKDTLIFTDTSTDSNSILSYDGLSLSTTENGIEMSIQDLAGDDAILRLGFSSEGSDILSSGETARGLQIDMTSNYTLHAAGNTLYGALINMGNGGAGVSTGIRVDGSPDYGILLTGYGSSAIRFDSSETSFSSDLNYNISADPGGSGDFLISSSGGTKLLVDTNGTSSADTGYFAISSSSSTTIGTNLDAGIYLDFQTNTSSSNTDFFPISIQTNQDTGGGIYLDGCNGGTVGAETCDDGANWTMDGIVFRDFHYDLTTETDADGDGDFDLDIVPKGDGGVEVNLDVSDGIALGADVDDKAFRIISSSFHGSSIQELFEVRRDDGAVDFDGALARFVNNEASINSDGVVVSVENQNINESNVAGLVLIQATVNQADSIAPLSSAQALIIKVNESQSSDDTVAIYSDADGTPDLEFTFENDGDAFADGSFTGGGADLAEFFLSDDSTLGAHDVVCRDEDPNAVRRCALGERNVVGVISTNPAFIGNNVGGAGVDLRTDPRYRLVGLVGQVETRVTAADGSIAIGDALTASSFTEGAAGKARGSGYIIGRALEPLSAGTGTIKVLVQPMWWAGDIFSEDGGVAKVSRDLRFASLASAAEPLLSSPGISFAGSVWGAQGAASVGFSQNVRVTSADTYAMVWSSLDGGDVMELRSSGDLLLTGRLYPGDRGVAQDQAYIYYDAAGGGYMRTNAAGWSVGSYDFAETYASSQELVAGEVVEFGFEAGTVQRSMGEEYSDRIVGIVSTRPGFLAGELTEGNYPIALSGRVPAKVTVQNGAVNIGDPLTTSAVPGVLMKATRPGPVVGYALESQEAEGGVISVFVRPTYFDGVTPVEAEGVQSATVVSQLQLTGDVFMAGGVLQGVGRLEGINNAWSLAEDGTLRTMGRLEQMTRGHNGDTITTTVPGTFGRTVTVSGTALLQNGRAEVRFSPEYLAIVSPVLPPRVFATPHALVSSIAVLERTPLGFTLASHGGESGVAVDWYAIAPHMDDEQSWGAEDVVQPPVVISDPDIIAPINEQVEETEVIEHVPEPEEEVEIIENVPEPEDTLIVPIEVPIVEEVVEETPILE